jgi:phosphoglycerate kinase
MISLDDYNFSGKKALVRVDFDVPMDEKFNITDDTRIVTALPTIRQILASGGAVIILTHLGRPTGTPDEKLSCRHLLSYLSELLAQEVLFADDCIGSEAQAKASSLKSGEVLLLENLRFHQEEFAADKTFAQKLAELGDAYVNNAFGTAHRAHASTYTIAEFFPYDKMFGYLMEIEMKNIDRVLNNPKKPFTAILGGEKISTKIHIIEALFEKVDNLIICGGISYTFVKALGGNIGDSIIDSNCLQMAKSIMDRAKQRKINLYLPEDCVVGNEATNRANIEHCPINEIPNGWMGLDIGIKSAETIALLIDRSSTILWNGPIGTFEIELFANGTLRIALAVARATDKGAFSLIGGGDTIAAIKNYALAHKMSYLSTAGGALLEYIQGKKLPSIRAIEDSYSVDDINFHNKRALIRVDFNVPLDENQEITDDTRIVTALPTIRKVLADGGSAVIMTHLGRPKGMRKDSLSTKHIVPRLSKLLQTDVKHAPDSRGAETHEMVENLSSGEALLLENLRFHPEETGADEDFARELSTFGDIYINNAFGTAHRAHASTYTVARFFPQDKRMLGYLVESEINNIDRVLHKSKAPFVAIIGGSKVSTKIHIIEALVKKVDALVLGGGIVFTFIKALGGNVGESIIENDCIDVAKSILRTAEQNGVAVHLPSDCVIADKLSNDAQIRHCEINSIPDGWMGLDIGIRSCEQFAQAIERSKTVLWNGPMGVFELTHFSMGTLRVAMAVARATDKGAYSLIGGGDSIAAVNRYALAHKISYISTAGGALLEYIEGKELPSLAAIKGRF